ncbi:MAG: hypothetical protein ACKOOF_10695 [Planctomycetaceae bacterium]
MAPQHFLDDRGAKSQCRRSRLAVESLEQRVPLAADVVTAIAPISISCEPVPAGPDGMVVKPMPMPFVIVGDGGASSPGFPGVWTGSGSVSGEPGVVICVFPGPDGLPWDGNPAVTGGPDAGGENVIFMTTAVQRTNTAGVRPAAIVSQRLGGQPRIAPAPQQTARPRRTNDVQATSLPVSRQPQPAGHFSRQITARFARLSAAAIR